jgi:NADH dehydrogenase FAD-containing subunit
LASTAVGTLEFRTTLESIRKPSSGVEFFQGWADDVNFSKKKVMVEESAIQRNESLALTADANTAIAGHETKKGKVFEIAYDKLVVAVGCYSQTFGTKGVRENALFLKDVGDARKIRKRILDCKLNDLISASRLTISIQASKLQHYLLHQIL